MPCERAAGSRPSVATSMVIMMGRSRSTAPSIAESAIDRGRARASWLMYSSMITPVCTDTPNSARNPTPEDTLKCVPVEVQRQQAADGRHRHVDQDQRRPFERTEHGVENQEDHQQRERNNDREALVGALLRSHTRPPSQM